MTDKFDDQAEALLEQFPDDWSPRSSRVIKAVGAALREKGIEIEQYKSENLFLNKGHEQLLTEIEKLREQLKIEAEQVWNLCAEIATRDGNIHGMIRAAQTKERE